MKKNILTEQGNPATRRIDLMGTDEIVAAISHEDMKVPPQTPPPPSPKTFMFIESLSEAFLLAVL